MWKWIGEVEREISKSDEKFGVFRSSHEGYGVLAEEVAELLDAIRANDLKAIRAEAIQVSAAALRIARSLDDPSCRDRSGIS